MLLLHTPLINPTVLTLALHLGPYINYRVNIAQHNKLHKSMRTIPLSAVCVERRLNALQPKQPCWSEGYPKPKPGTYCHISDVLLLFSSHKPIWPQPYPVIYVVANPVRGLLDRKRSEEDLPSSYERKTKTQTHKKRRRERNRNNKIHIPEKDRRGAFDRESLA